MTLMRKLYATAILSLALASDHSPAVEKTTYVVLVDTSSSVTSNDRQVYRESFDNIRKAVRPGDRIVISTIGRKNRAEWVRETDTEVPIPTGRRFVDEKTRKDFEGEIGKTFEALLQRSYLAPEMVTRILDTLEAASQAYGQDPKSGKALVIMSDMVETGRFDLGAGQSKPAKAPPELAGAKVYVAGAGGGKAYQGIETFWKRYFDTVPGAAVVEYGRYPVRLR